jgi:hypothetical protein
MSSLTLVWHVKCTSSQFNHFIQLNVTKDALMDGWLHTTKSQSSLAHVTSITKSQLSLT